MISIMYPISVAEARAFDKDAQEKLGIPSLILMENAGRSVAEEAVKRCKGQGKRVAVICGVGNNGGDGFVAARHLINAGSAVDVYIVGETSKIKFDAEINYNILSRMGAEVRKVGSIKDLDGIKRADLIIDAIFGIGINSKINEPFFSVINHMNKLNIPILAADVPSGMDADTGEILGAAVKADITVTFVAAKKGFYLKDGPQICGKIIVRDIGISKQAAKNKSE